MTPHDLAVLHGRAMTTPRPWTAAEFSSLLAGEATWLLTHEFGFALGRSVADEAELLTLVVDRVQLRRGIGRHLLTAFELEARERGATSAFLEVAADNAGALALYRAQGYSVTGTRRSYYSQPDGSRIDALVMMTQLSG